MPGLVTPIIYRPGQKLVTFYYWISMSENRSSTLTDIPTLGSHSFTMT